MSVVGNFIARAVSGSLFWYRYTFKLRASARRVGRNLNHVKVANKRPTKIGVPAVVPYYGNHLLLNWFLEYYRALGIEYFVFLDLGAGADLIKWLSTAEDCEVWQPNGFLHPGMALHALNFLRRRYAHGSWCLSIEPFDLLVFPRSENRHIRDLIDFVESEQRENVFAIVVDAYSDKPARSTGCSVDKSPQDLLPYFDRFGYQSQEVTPNLEVPVQGGVQRRALYGDHPRRTPVLNRMPLVKFTKNTFYVASTRKLVPARLNKPHADWHSTTTACLVRYAMLSDDLSLHIAKQAEDGQLYPDDNETLYAGSEKMASMDLKNQNSAVFRSSQDLLACGLLNNGQWF